MLKKSPKVLTKSKKITDAINELFSGKQIEDPEDDSNDESHAKVTEYDEDYDREDVDLQLSEFRKKNLILLENVDKKYRGNVSSRKEMIDDEESMEESEDEDSEADDLVEESEDSEAEGLEAEDSEAEDSEADDSDAEEIEQKSDDSESGDDLQPENEEDSDDSEAENESDESESDNDSNSENEENIESDSNNVTKSNEVPLFPNTDPISNVQKGLAVQNQLKIWENLLEIRIHSQKLITNANTLPSYDLIEKLKTEENYKTELDKTTENVSELLSKMIELQSTLVSRFDETNTLNFKTSQSRKRKHDNNDDKLIEFTDILNHNFNEYQTYSNSVIKKWDDRTKLFSSTSAKSSKQNDYGILRRIEGVLTNKKEIIRKTQQVKGNYELFRPDLDQNIEYIKKNQKNDNEIQDQQNDLDQEIYSKEIYDDTDFYHQLLRELIEFKTTTLSNPIELSKQYAELEKLRKKMKKVVDTRASKGRKIRYVVHKKLINFMAPNEFSQWTNESKDELYSSLFGKSDKKYVDL